MQPRDLSRHVRPNPGVGGIPRIGFVPARELASSRRVAGVCGTPQPRHSARFRVAGPGLRGTANPGHPGLSVHHRLRSDAKSASSRRATRSVPARNWVALRILTLGDLRRVGRASGEPHHVGLVGLARGSTHPTRGRSLGPFHGVGWPFRWPRLFVPTRRPGPGDPGPKLGSFRRVEGPPFSSELRSRSIVFRRRAIQGTIPGASGPNRNVGGPRSVGTALLE